MPDVIRYQCPRCQETQRFETKIRRTKETEEFELGRAPFLSVAEFNRKTTNGKVTCAKCSTVIHCSLDYLAIMMVHESDTATDIPGECCKETLYCTECGKSAEVPEGTKCECGQGVMVPQGWWCADCQMADCYEGQVRDGTHYPCGGGEAKWIGPNVVIEDIEETDIPLQHTELP